MKMKFKFNRKAFTLVELLIVIAIIGILFVVLVSKVDFATDKAKTTGVQTDFRSFQVAFETVSRENAGFNTLGWDTGDKADASLIAGYTYLNADKDGGDRIRNSYDKGDMNLNGICEEGETWTGQKLYTETWTGIYTLDNPADATDMSAYILLETAINKNLDPALRISIDPENKTIYMANGYQDPWTTEYHGFYLSNAKNDGKDRGAIVMYSDGPNKVFGSEQTIANGIVAVTVKNGAVQGQDDLSLVTCYTYTNGYGEIGTTTFGFSNNQVQAGGGNGGSIVAPSEPAGPGAGGYQMLTKPTEPITTIENVEFRSEAEFDTFDYVKVNNNVIDGSNYIEEEGSIKITLKSRYISTLSNGTHTMEIVSKDGGSAICEFTLDVCTHPNGFEYPGPMCYTCGYYCEHPYASENIEYHPNYSTYPTKLPGTHQKCIICATCDDYYEYIANEPCTYNGSSICTYCEVECTHNPSYATVDSNGICSVCGKQCMHDVLYYDVGDNVRCNACATVICSSDTHTYENGTCTKCSLTYCSHEYEYYDMLSNIYCYNCDRAVCGDGYHISDKGICIKCQYQTCRHDWWNFEDGVCSCGYVCEHTSVWSDDQGNSYCNLCDILRCKYNEHAYSNGICTKCNLKCPHTKDWFEREGVCFNCRMRCPHQDENGTLWYDANDPDFIEPSTDTTHLSKYLCTGCWFTVNIEVPCNWDYSNARYGMEEPGVHIIYGLVCRTCGNEPYCIWGPCDAECQANNH